MSFFKYPFSECGEIKVTLSQFTPLERTMKTIDPKMMPNSSYGRAL